MIFKFDRRNFNPANPPFLYGVSDGEFVYCSQFDDEFHMGKVLVHSYAPHFVFDEKGRLLFSPDLHFELCNGSDVFLSNEKGEMLMYTQMNAWTNYYVTEKGKTYYGLAIREETTLFKITADQTVDFSVRWKDLPDRVRETLSRVRNNKSQPMTKEEVANELKQILASIRTSK